MAAVVKATIYPAPMCKGWREGLPTIDMTGCEPGFVVDAIHDGATVTVAPGELPAIQAEASMRLVNKVVIHGTLKV